MSIDYTVSSLPALAFGQPAPLTLAKFAEAAPDFAALAGAPGEAAGPAAKFAAKWRDVETQLRNAAASARGGERFARPAEGCSVFWRSRVAACFQEKDPLRRDEAIDRVWWDAAGELADPASPLGPGALAAYAVRLGIALRRARISEAAGSAAFDRLTDKTKMAF